MSPLAVGSPNNSWSSFCSGEVLLNLEGPECRRRSEAKGAGGYANLWIKFHFTVNPDPYSKMDVDQMKGRK